MFDGLEVTVNDALLMRGIERIGDLAGERERRRRRELAREAICSASVSPSTSSITSAVTPCGLFDAVDGRYVRMIDRREHAGFALEALHASRV